MAFVYLAPSGDYLVYTQVHTHIGTKWRITQTPNLNEATVFNRRPSQLSRENAKLLAGCTILPVRVERRVYIEAEVNQC